MIVSCDIHLREETEGVVFDEVLPGLVQAALASSLERRIAILGDLWHVRYRVSVRLQNRLFDFVDSSGVQWILLPGNHDQISPAGEHALEVFRELDNVVVVSEPTWAVEGLWIPYRKDPEDIRWALSLTKPKLCPPIVWTHHGVRGAFMNNRIRDTEGLPLDLFGGFHRVYCGHYHKPQDVGLVRYIGSPYQTRADESGQQKFYGVWTEANKDMEMFSVEWGRKFHRIIVTPDSPLVLADGIRPDDEIRVQAGDGVNPEELGKAIAGQGFTNVVVTPVQKATAARLQVDPDKGLVAYAQGYVEKFAGELDPAKLMALYQEFVN